MTISDKRILQELAELKTMLLSLSQEVRALRELLESREDAYLTPEEERLVDATQQALAEGKKDQFVKLNDL